MPPKRSITDKASGITGPRGFRAAGVHCGIKSGNSPDLMLITSAVPCAAAGVFTRSRLPAAAVQVTRRHIRSGYARAIVCNSGNANAGTGERGLADADRMARLVATEAQDDAIGPQDVLVCSTGVIGHHLPMRNVQAGIRAAAMQLGRGRACDRDAARAIMTTDLVPKSAARSIPIPASGARIAGIAKGSGMIAPNMATMLAFITTDAAVAPPALRQALKAATDVSFNRISVDGHTSPSDCVLVLTNAQAGGRTIRAPGAPLNRFRDALAELCRDLAYQIVKDGEGATRVFRVAVHAAATQRDADRVAKAVVDSPLVKAAVHGKDPNWGRITTAAAACGVKITPQTMSLSIGQTRPVSVYRKGTPSKLTAAAKAKLKRLMRAKEVTFTLDLGMGNAATEWLGCDLSAEYVRINAEYTT